MNNKTPLDSRRCASVYRPKLDRIDTRRGFHIGPATTSAALVYWTQQQSGTPVALQNLVQEQVFLRGSTSESGKAAAWPTAEEVLKQHHYRPMGVTPATQAFTVQTSRVVVLFKGPAKMK